jgi:hypothetical protein
MQQPATAPAPETTPEPEPLRLGGVSRALADPHSSTSLSGRARARRWDELLRNFPDFERMRVLDLGGTTGFWHAAPVRPADLVIVNRLAEDAPWDGDGSRALRDDVCGPMAALAGERFDLVIANSVLGFVGGHAKRQALAAHIHEKADHHWVQTAYRYFPIEPCTVFPLFQLLPLRLQAEVCLRWPLGYRGAASLREAVENSLTNDVLSKTHLRHYFPDSAIWHERLLGVTKSLVAVKS